MSRLDSSANPSWSFSFWGEGISRIGIPRKMATTTTCTTLPELNARNMFSGTRSSTIWDSAGISATDSFTSLVNCMPTPGLSTTATLTPTISATEVVAR